MPWGSSSANSDQIQIFWRRAYIESIRLGAQQMRSMLMDLVDREPLAGQHIFIDNYGALAISDTPSDDDVIERTNRFALNTFKDMTRQRTAMVPRHWEFTHWLDPRDQMRTMRALRPDGQFLRNALAGFARRIDRLILTGLDGNRLTGALANSTFATDGGITIGADVGGANSNLTMEKVVTLRRRLEVNGVQRDVPWSIVMHPNQMYGLLLEAGGTTNKPVVASADFNSIHTLVGGMMNQGFMGFDNWVMTTEIDPESVAEGSSYATDTRNVFAFARDAAALGFNSNVDVRFDERWDRGHILQVAHYLDANATRVMGEKIARVGCFD